MKYTWGLNGSGSFPYSDFISAPGYNAGSSAPVDGGVCDYWYQTPAVLERQVGYTAGGAAVLTQTFSYSTTQGSSFNLWGSKQTTVKTTDNTTGQTYQTVYTYSSVDQVVSPIPPGGQLPVQIPVEQSVAYEDGSGQALEAVAKAWLDPYRLGCETETFSNGTSGTWYLYNNNYPEITDEEEYDYGTFNTACSSSTVTSPPGVTPARKTVTAYQSFAAGPTGGTIYDKPSSVQVYGNGTLAAETDYAYSNQATATGAVQHDEANYGPGSAAPRGNPTTVTRKCLAGCPDDVTQYAYDETGQVISSADAKGNTTNYSYADNPVGGNPAGNSNAYLTLVTRPVINGVAHTESFQYNYATGELTSATDENSETTTYKYNTPPANCSTPDGLNRLSEADYPDGGQITYCYNDAGHSVTESTLATPDPTVVRTTLYDGMGHVVQTQLTSDPSGTDYVDTTYDGSGRVASVTNPYRSTTDPTYGSFQYTYDALGRKLTQCHLPDGDCARWTYVGNETEYQDPASILTDWYTDALGRMTQFLEPNSTGQPVIPTNYTYDALNDLASVTQEGVSGETPRVRSFSYDGLSRLTIATNPESGTTNYQYTNGSTLCSGDPSNVCTKTDARGIVTSYSYDALNRLTAKSYANDPQNTPSVSYVYDIKTGSAWEQQSWGGNVIGHLSQVVTSVGSSPQSDWTAAGYDQMGRSEGYIACTGASSLSCSGVAQTTANYDFDLAGRYEDVADGVCAVCSPDEGFGKDVNYGYDGAGNMNAALSQYYPASGSAVATMVLANTAYTPFGAISAADLSLNANNNPQIWLVRNYDTRMRLTGETDTATSSQAQLYSYSLTMNPDGDATGASDSVVGTWSYSPDPERRLQDLVASAGYYNGASLHFHYDSFGNRTALSSVGDSQAPVPGTATFQYNANNQLTSGALYDAAGNVTDDGVNRYLYDAEGRLCAAQSDFTLAMTGYLYDGLGNRIAKGTLTTFSCNIASNGFATTVSYVPGPDGEQLLTAGGSGNMIGSNVYANGALLASYTPDGNLHYNLNDWVETKRVQVSAAGAVEESCTSLPFGDELNCTPSGSDATDLHFTGKERDTESGLDYFGARYFGSSMGRFMSPDPLGGHLENPQSLNKYAYALNNPLTNTDPTGLDSYLQCTSTKDNASTCQSQTVGYDKNGKAQTATVQGVTGKNGFTATLIGNDANGNLVDKTTGTGSYTASVNGSGVQFSNNGGQSSSTGVFVNGTPQTTFQDAGFANGGALSGFSFTLTNSKMEANQTEAGSFSFNGTAAQAGAALQRAGFSSRLGTEGGNEYRSPGSTWTGANSGHFIIPPNASVPAAGNMHFGEHNPYSGMGVGAILHCASDRAGYCE